MTRQLKGCRWTEDEVGRLVYFVELSKELGPVDWFDVALSLNRRKGSRSDQACKQKYRQYIANTEAWHPIGAFGKDSARHDGRPFVCLLARRSRAKELYVPVPRSKGRSYVSLGNTNISWSEFSWNPVRGCTRVSAECTNCYAEMMTARFSGVDGKTGLPLFGAGFAKMTKAGPRWTNKVALIESKLEEPLHWGKPRMIFVNSMSDLWHEELAVKDIAKVYDVMDRCARHTFQVLTKRPDRRRKILTRWGEMGMRPSVNVREGTSVGIRSAVDRIDALRETPAAVRFLSCEPLLEDLGKLDLTGIDWVIIGGESGPKARPMELAWAERLMDQCVEHGVACFFKQTGSVLARKMGLQSRKGSDPSEWPKSRGWPQEFPR